MYLYPSRPTGTAEDLMGLVIAAAERAAAREGAVLPDKPPLVRALLEPPFNLAGMLARALFELLPPDAVLAIHDRGHRALAGGQAYPFDPAAPALERAAAESRALARRCGAEPALFALVSHPPVLGELGHLNFELTRHALLALRAVRGRPCRPRLVAAVDPFALDTVGLAAEGAYAGVIGLYHLGLDRLSFSRGRLSALLLGEAAWPRLAWRLARRLRAGGEAAMALSGGTPATARVLYTAREWVWSRRRASPLRGRPAEVLERLRRDPDFRRFESQGRLGPALKRSAWRLLEAWLMSAAAGRPWDPESAAAPAAETGILAEAELSVARRGQRALGLDDDPESLASRFSRETPPRGRLFRFLAARVLARGRPLLFLPVVHSVSPPGVAVRDAWSWESLRAGAVFGRVLGEAPRAWEGTAEAFAEDFSRTNYA